MAHATVIARGDMKMKTTREETTTEKRKTGKREKKKERGNCPTFKKM